MGVRGWLAVLALVVVVVVAALASHAGRHNRVLPAATTGGTDAVLVDADEHGAIVIDGRGRATGVRRDGTVAWRAVLDATAAVPVGCLASCPDAVLSGSAASVNSPSVPDPEPVLVVAGRQRGLAGPVASVKRQVLAADAAGDLVLATADAAGRASLVVHRDGAALRIGVAGWHTSWASAADGGHALAVTSVAPGVSQARWFDRDAGGWRPAGTAFPVAGTGSCVAPGGQRAILLGQRPQLVDRGGTGTPITGMDTAGTCAFAAGGAGIVGELLLRMSGPLSRLRAFDAAGAVTWARDLPAEARVAGDPTGHRVAYVAGGALHELDPSTGASLRTVPAVHAAAYDGTGALVVVRPDLTVTWLA